MVKYEIDLVGLNHVYMKKLSVYLQKRLQKQAAIRIWESDLPETAEDAHRAEGRIILAGPETAGGQRPSATAAACCCLTISADRQACAGDVLYMYQSADSLYNRIFEAYERHRTAGGRIAAAAAGPRILTFFGTDAGAGLLPYAATCARILSRERHTLFVNLISCSGMRELFDLPPAGADLSDLFLALRQGRGGSLDPYTGLLDALEYTAPLESPGILDELTAEDLVLFLDHLTDCGYEAVVIAQDGLRFWTRRLIELSGQVICLTDTQLSSVCRYHALHAFYEKCRTGPDTGRLAELKIQPVFPLERGVHLLQEWEEGPPGELLRSMLDRTGIFRD